MMQQRETRGNVFLSEGNHGGGVGIEKEGLLESVLCTVKEMWACCR